MFLGVFVCWCHGLKQLFWNLFLSNSLCCFCTNSHLSFACDSIYWCIESSISWKFALLRTSSRQSLIIFILSWYKIAHHVISGSGSPAACRMVLRQWKPRVFSLDLAVPIDASPFCDSSCARDIFWISSFF